MSTLIAVSYPEATKAEGVRQKLVQMQKDYLFALVRKSTPDKVLEELKGSGGTILQTSLSHDDEARLQAALSAVKG